MGNIKVMEMCKSLANQLLTYALTIRMNIKERHTLTIAGSGSKKIRETVFKYAQRVYPISMAEFTKIRLCSTVPMEHCF